MLATGIFLTGAALAGGDELVATNRFSEATVGFDLGGDYRNVTLTITEPNGFTVMARSKRTAPVINLRKFGKVEDGRCKVEDGRCSYQLSAVTSKRIAVRTELDNGRGDSAKNEQYAGVSASGSLSDQGRCDFPATGNGRALARSLSA
ncbi:hypothetical protein [Breoghania sp.]|uniref:hypothetical protein n=1 Tax=Breoghania sp. TaxID=2065378 RepID=UPI002629C543|nr:hypothetical protein [Breoghania sp.]